MHGVAGSFLDWEARRGDSLWFNSMDFRERFPFAKLTTRISNWPNWLKEDGVQCLDNMAAADSLHHGEGEPVSVQRPFPESVPVIR